jgi:hypothetical protein
MATESSAPLYEHIAEFADAIVEHGAHDAFISTGGKRRPEHWTCSSVAGDTERLVMFPTKRGGRCYPVDECADPLSGTRWAVISTAAMRNRLAAAS